MLPTPSNNAPKPPGWARLWRSSPFRTLRRMNDPAAIVCLPRTSSVRRFLFLVLGLVTLASGVSRAWGAPGAAAGSPPSSATAFGPDSLASIRLQIALARYSEAEVGARRLWSHVEPSFDDSLRGADVLDLL